MTTGLSRRLDRILGNGLEHRPPCIWLMIQDAGRKRRLVGFEGSATPNAVYKARSVEGETEVTRWSQVKVDTGFWNGPPLLAELASRDTKSVLIGRSQSAHVSLFFHILQRGSAIWQVTSQWHAKISRMPVFPVS
jgi:hypothetical protein